MPKAINDTFSANLTKGSLKPTESRQLASMLCQGSSPAEVIERAVEENFLQKRSPSSNQTYASYIVKRLCACPQSVIDIVAKGSNREVVQGALVATLAESRLLRSFFEHTVADLKSIGRGYLTASDWTSFMEWLESVEPAVIKWTPVVRDKLRQNIWRILAESEIVNSTKSLGLQNLRLETSVRSCLTEPSLSEVARALAAVGAE
jgi:hypothetical protein